LGRVIKKFGWSPWTTFCEQVVDIENKRRY
jgi:hypothetical protein